MSIKYTVSNDEFIQRIIAEHENGDVWVIPIDPSNSDYQAYLNPKAEQSTPSFIDEA
jgi:hypothetical protein